MFFLLIDRNNKLSIMVGCSVLQTAVERCKGAKQLLLHQLVETVVFFLSALDYRLHFNDVEVGLAHP
jgi:hypothetical protein